MPLGPADGRIPPGQAHETKAESGVATVRHLTIEGFHGASAGGDASQGWQSALWIEITSQSVAKDHQPALGFD